MRISLCNICSVTCHGTLVVIEVLLTMQFPGKEGRQLRQNWTRSPIVVCKQVNHSGHNCDWIGSFVWKCELVHHLWTFAMSENLRESFGTRHEGTPWVEEWEYPAHSPDLAPCDFHGKAAILHKWRSPICNAAMVLGCWTRIFHQWHRKSVSLW